MNIEDVRTQYLLFNNLYFDGQMPVGMQIEISFSEEIDTDGRWQLEADGSHSIQLSTRLLSVGLWVVWITLLHEMVHVFCEEREWYDHIDHGSSFQKVIGLLEFKGAYTKWL